MQKKDNANHQPQRRRSRLKTIKLSNDYANARYEGEPLRDGVAVKIDDSGLYKHGDLVAYECQHESCCPEGSYHAGYYRRVNGKKWDFRLARHHNHPTGRLYKDGEVNIIGRVVEVVDKKTKRGKGEAVSLLWNVTIAHGLPAFGLFKGDEVYVQANNTAPVGKIIGIKGSSSGLIWFARVCSNDKRGIFIVDHEDDRGMLDDYNYSEFGPVIKIEKANAENIAELKKRIEKVRRDDNDSICNTTRLFEMERELYELERPLEEEDGSDEWPEVIGGAR